MAVKKISIADLIQDPEDETFLKFLVFGPSGVGKTHLLGTAQADPRLSPVLVLSFEGGQRVLVGSGVKVVKISSWEDFNRVYASLEQEDHGFKTIAVDSLSEAHVWALLTVLKREGKNRRNPDLIDLEDYNTGAVQIRRFVRYLRDLPMNFIATATELQEIDPRSGPVMKPNMVGKLANELPGLFETVGHYVWAEVQPEKRGEEAQTVRVLLLHGDTKSRAKVRIPMSQGGLDNISEYLIDPTMSDLLDELGFEAKEMDNA